jgi:hypothetical protein
MCSNPVRSTPAHRRRLVRWTTLVGLLAVLATIVIGTMTATSSASAAESPARSGPTVAHTIPARPMAAAAANDVNRPPIHYGHSGMPSPTNGSRTGGGDESCGCGITLVVPTTTDDCGCVTATTTLPPGTPAGTPTETTTVPPGTPTETTTVPPGTPAGTTTVPPGTPAGTPTDTTNTMPPPRTDGTPPETTALPPGAPADHPGDSVPVSVKRLAYTGVSPAFIPLLGGGIVVVLLGAILVIASRSGPTAQRRRRRR